MDAYTVRLPKRAGPPTRKTTTLACGTSHVAAVLSDGTVWCHGHDGCGKCSGATGITDAVSVSCGANHTAALLSDGTVRCWGFDDDRMCSAAANITDAVGIAAGTFVTAALLADGTVRCWGYNGYGQCRGAAGMRDAVMVACSDHRVFALRSDGSIQCSCKDGRTREMEGVANVVKIACGPEHLVALRADGTVLRWNYSNLHQSAVAEDITEAIDVACTARCIFVLLSDNTIRTIHTRPPRTDGYSYLCRTFSVISILCARMWSWWRSWWPSEEYRIVALVGDMERVALLTADGTARFWWVDGGRVDPSTLRVVPDVRLPCEYDMTPPGAYLLK